MKLSWAFVFAFSALTSADERVWDGASDSCWFLTEGGTDGQCLAEDCCAGSDWVVGECPSYANDWRCCFSYNQCADECGSCSDSVARDYACRLMVMYEAGRIFLKPNHFNELGNDPYDGASSLSNILDTCQGKQVKRSAYCAEAPGGCTCLRGSMVKALYEYATKFWNENGERLEVNALAGSCHSSLNSWHYVGNTFDVSCSTPFWHCEELVEFVRQYPLEELCYPGGPCSGHDTWVHAAFV